MYRKLSLLTHPDKQNGTDELFKVVKEAYDKYDILKLISIAVKFNIEITEDIDYKIWDDEMLKIKRQIEYLKKGGNLVFHLPRFHIITKKNYKFYCGISFS